MERRHLVYFGACRLQKGWFNGCKGTKRGERKGVCFLNPSIMPASVALVWCCCCCTKRHGDTGLGHCCQPGSEPSLLDSAGDSYIYRPLVWDGHTQTQGDLWESGQLRPHRPEEQTHAPLSAALPWRLFKEPQDGSSIPSPGRWGKRTRGSAGKLEVSVGTGGSGVRLWTPPLLYLFWAVEEMLHYGNRQGHWQSDPERWAWLHKVELSCWWYTIPCAQYCFGVLVLYN